MMECYNHTSTIEKGHRIPDKCLDILWNPGGHTIILKRNTTINYSKELDYIEKFQSV